MKNAFTLVEVMIVVAILGLSAAIIIPDVTRAKQESERNKILSPAELNDYQIKCANFIRVAEFRGYDIYTFHANGSGHAVAIPVTNSVYDLERK